MIECREREVHDCCLKSYVVFYFSNVWWDHIPNANCLGVKREHCSIDAAMVFMVLIRAVTSTFTLYLSKSKSNPRKSYSSKSTSKTIYLKYK